MHRRYYGHEAIKVWYTTRQTPASNVKDGMVLTAVVAAASIANTTWSADRLQQITLPTSADAWGSNYSFVAR